MTTGITIDGRDYNIRIKYETLRRAFQITEGPNSGTAIDGTMIRDIIGTKYDYQIDIEPDPADPGSTGSPADKHPPASPVLSVVPMLPHTKNKVSVFPVQTE